MLQTRQILIQNLTPETLNGHLDRGARVIWIRVDETGLYDAVLDTVIEDAPDPVGIVVEFLHSVPVSGLEETMLSDRFVALSPGQQAIEALLEMITPRGDRGT